MGSSYSKVCDKLGEYGPFEYSIGIGTVGMIAWIYLLQDHNSTRACIGNRDILGLQNTGNTCYLNSLLQALGACDKFTKYLNDKNSINQLVCAHKFLTRTRPMGPQLEIPDTDEPKLRGRYELEPPELWTMKDAMNPMINCLTRAFAIINRNVFGKDFALSEQVPQEIIKCFADKNYFTFARNEEQDSFEIFNMIMKEISDQNYVANLYLETIRVILATNKTPDEENNHVHPITGAGDYVEPPIQVPTISSNIRNPFQCSIATQLCCTSCGKSNPVMLEEANCISVSFPRYTNPFGGFPLPDLMKNALKAELVHNVDCEECSKKSPGNQVKTTFRKKTAIARLPKSLCIHIQRSVWDTCSLSTGATKRMDLVHFPALLDLSNTGTLGRLMVSTQRHEDMTTRSSSRIGMPEFAEPEQRSLQSLYGLRSVICHSGDASSGHFTTFRKSSHDDRLSEWYMVSDSEVIPVEFSTVKRSTAYMLFYETLTVV